MKSPFPGIDPYLESQHYWPDFHVTFLAALSEVMNDVLPRDYEARINERMQIIEAERGERSYIPDVSVVQRGQGAQDPQEAKGSAATLEAVTLDLPVMQEIAERWIEILHRPERDLVAVVELLSATNKIGEGRGQYLGKRMDLLNREVHLVELDFLLGGERLPMRQPLPAGDFYVIVSRAQARRRGQVYAWSIRSGLPTIPIPLRKPDKDIFVDLGAVFATAYERGRYAKSIDYGAGLRVPLSEESRKWAEEVGKRAQG